MGAGDAGEDRVHHAGREALGVDRRIPSQQRLDQDRPGQQGQGELDIEVRPQFLGKGDKANLTKAERNVLAEVLPMLADEYRAGQKEKEK